MADLSSKSRASSEPVDTVHTMTDRQPTTKSNSRSKLAVLLVAISLVVVAVAVVLPRLGSTPDKISMKPEMIQAMTASCNEDVDCIVEQLETFAQQSAPLEALGMYLKVTEANRTFITGCHEVTHQFGRWAWATYGEAAFDKDAHECLFGYTHGFLVGMADDLTGEDFNAAASALCGLITEREYRLLCTHGVGHGAAHALTPITEASELCITYSDLDYAGACIEGAMMEWQQVILKGEKSFEELASACVPINRLNERLYANCLGAVLQYGVVTPAQLSALSAHCEPLDKAEYAGCETALGNAVFAEPLQQRRKTLPLAAELATRYCMIDRSAECIIALTNNVFLASMDADGTRAMCATLAYKLRIGCDWAVEHQSKVVPADSIAFTNG